MQQKWWFNSQGRTETFFFLYCIDVTDDIIGADLLNSPRLPHPHIWHSSVKLKCSHIRVWPAHERQRWHHIVWWCFFMMFYFETGTSRVPAPKIIHSLLITVESGSTPKQTISLNLTVNLTICCRYRPWNLNISFRIYHHTSITPIVLLLELPQLVNEFNFSSKNVRYLVPAS